MRVVMISVRAPGVLASSCALLPGAPVRLYVAHYATHDACQVHELM